MQLLSENDEDVPDFAAELEGMQENELMGDVEDLTGSILD
jgi:hypothetical protein